MTDLPPGSPPQSERRLSDGFRTLRRSRSDRVAAGVLGGLGRRLEIDPVVLRIVTVVLAIFGGAGVLLYTVAWLLVPAENEDGSVLDHALGRREEDQGGSRPLALGLVVVAAFSATGIISGSWDSGMLFVLAAAGLFVLVRRRDEAAAAREAENAPPAEHDRRPPGFTPDPVEHMGNVAASSPEQAGGPSVATSPAGAGSDSSMSPPHPEDDASTTDHTEFLPTAYGPSSGWPEGPDWGPTSAPVAEPPEPPAPPKRKSRSVLGPLTVCTALLAIGVLAINDASWASVPPAMYVALPLAVVAVGLLVGARYGRSRGLIILGLLLAMALVPATWVSRWNFDNVGNATYRITTIDQIPTEPRTHGAGEIHYDLSNLDIPAGETVTLDVEAGAGNLTVTVPEGVELMGDASVEGGEVNVLGESRDGFGQSFDLSALETERGSPDVEGGELVLNVELGFGELEVTR